MQTLFKFKQFVDEIQKENGKLYKQAIVEKHKDDEDIRYYLYFLFNPFITTGLSDKKLNKPIIATSFSTDISVKFNLDLLKEFNTGSDIMIMQMKWLLANTPADLQDILYKLITKNLQLGIDEKTINKVISGFIPTFDVMLANKYFDNPAIVEGREFVLTTKIDGGRIVAIKKNGEVKFYTRQGQEYEGLVDLEVEMKAYMPDNIALDGEITLLDKGKLSSKEQYKETMKITRREGEKHGVKMLVFDVLPLDVFENQTRSEVYKSRRQFLESVLSGHKFEFFRLLPVLYQGTDTLEITKWLNSSIAQGEEGIMINLADAPYEFRRTNSLLKVKKMQDVDLELIGFEEGTNRHTGRLGAILCEYKGNIVKCGSGFSDELRVEIWAHREDWLGRTVVIQYFEETTNDKGGTSLRFPVYLDYRTDK